MHGKPATPLRARHCRSEPARLCPPKRDPPTANDAITLYIEAIAELGRDTNLTGLGQSRELDFRRGSPRRNVFPSTAPRFVHREELFLLKHGVVVESDASNNERQAARGWLGNGRCPTVGPEAFTPLPDPDLDGRTPYCAVNLERLVWSRQNTIRTTSSFPKQPLPCRVRASVDLHRDPKSALGD